MSERRRPTAREIVDAVIESMHAAYEPLDDALVLVPSVFDVMLHPKAYQELRSLMPRIRTQAVRRLDEELLRLNTRPEGGLRGWLHRAAGGLRRFLFADRYAPARRSGDAVYERAGDRWKIDFVVTAEADAGVDYLGVETDFGVQQPVPLRGRPTVNLRRRTTRLPDGRFETVLTARRGTAPGAPRPGARTAATTIAASDVLARLVYEDQQGRHVYYMRKDQIVVGRGAQPGPGLDLALDTLSDVSREHVHIRRDPDDGGFAIKNVSRFGATVDGEAVPPSLTDEGADLDLWHPLPPRAEIGLANAAFLTFEDRTGK